ncbi:hypothetical protein SNE40_003091 [Patella caerulea]|uniref:TNFR-Cys domain-containing protein n=1 Tax=Patella caerulea TaxID=87958 RepID=A0AAN8Q872_PATCE
MENCTVYLTVLLIWLSAKHEVKASYCPHGEYLNAILNKCLNCSTCPDNQIFRVPCTNISDTVCGPFEEFNHFKHEDRTQVGVYLDEEPGIEVEGIPTKSSEDHYWKKLAFALIGVLCVLIIVATMVVWYACRKLHTSVQRKRADDEDSDDADNGYVVIRSIRQAPYPVTTETNGDGCLNNTTYQLLHQQRLVRPYRPKRRLLNEYADDVFESEDSAGSKSSRRVLSSIPEHTETTNNQPIV